MIAFIAFSLAVWAILWSVYVLARGIDRHAQDEPERIKRAVQAALEEQRAQAQEREWAEWDREAAAVKRQEAAIQVACPHKPDCITHYISPEIDTPGRYRSYLEAVPEFCRSRAERDATKKGTI